MLEVYMLEDPKTLTVYMLEEDIVYTEIQIFWSCGMLTPVE